MTTAAIVALVGWCFFWIIRDIIREGFRELEATIELALVDTDDDDPLVCEDPLWLVDDGFELPVPLRRSPAFDSIADILAANEAARADVDNLDWTAPAKWIER